MQPSRLFRQAASASLDIERRNLELARRELERNRELAERGTTSQSGAERVMLATRSAVCGGVVLVADDNNRLAQRQRNLRSEPGRL